MNFLPMAGALSWLYSTDFYAAILKFDSNILLGIQNGFRSGFLNVLFKIITHMGSSGALIAITLILLLIPKTRKMGICAAMSLIVSVIVCNAVLKNLFARIRPYEVINGLNCIVKYAEDFSFPSGHTSGAVSCFLSIFLASSKKEKIVTVWLLVLAYIIGFSRIYVGIHYPTDVLVSAVMAIGFAFLGTFLGKKIYGVLPEKWRTVPEFLSGKKKTAEPEKEKEPVTEQPGAADSK